MNAKELRIGNYIIENVETDIIGRVKGVNSYEADNTERVVYTERQTTPEEFIQPIPLTEEWLVNLGVIKHNYTKDMPEKFQRPDIDEDGNIYYTWVKGAFNLEIQESGEIWFEVYSHYIHVKWVHQLQNIYYALTGEELAYTQAGGV